MSEQTFVNDIINTNKTDYLSAIRVLLKQKNMKDNYFNIVMLLLEYDLPDDSIINITKQIVDNERSVIS